MRKLIVCVGLLLSSIAFANPIEFVVSASAGGPNDTVSRKIADKIKDNTGLNIVVVNKPGGAHNVAYNYVLASNKPTIIMETPQIEKHEVFLQLRDIYTAGYFTNILFVSEKSGIKTLSQLANKATVMFGHGGYGSFSHYAMDTLCSKQLQCVDVPYKSSAEGMLGLLTGDIDAYAIVSYGSKQFLENPKYSAIYTIRTGTNSSWYKIFVKNIPEKEIAIIKQTLLGQPKTFYQEMGLE